MFFVLSASDILLCVIWFCIMCNKPPGLSVIITHSHSQQIKFTTQSTLQNLYSSDSTQLITCSECYEMLFLNVH